MPSPRNRLKGTGDLHPPEVEDEFGRDAEAFAQEPSVGLAEAVTVASGEIAAPLVPQPVERHGVLAAARAQVRAHPIAAVAGAFALGLLLARI